MLSIILVLFCNIIIKWLWNFNMLSFDYRNAWLIYCIYAWRRSIHWVPSTTQWHGSCHEVNHSKGNHWYSTLCRFHQRSVEWQIATLRYVDFLEGKLSKMLILNSMQTSSEVSWVIATQCYVDFLEGMLSNMLILKSMQTSSEFSWLQYSSCWLYEDFISDKYVYQYSTLSVCAQY